MPHGRPVLRNLSLDDLVNVSGRNPILRIMRRAAAHSRGLPLAVQVVALPYREEQCVNVMKMVESMWKRKARMEEDGESSK